MKKSLSTSVSAWALIAAMSPCALLAQESGPTAEGPALDDDTDEIIVTGIRGSLRLASEVKRNATGVVDAISAKDIGDFPDTNLAESLQRITGVSIDRTNGEGNQISVRGFGPSFNLVTLNGRQMPGASSPKQENADSQLQPRTFNFAEISSDSISSVEVYKTSRPDLPSGGIGATVNIKTARPLEMEPFVLSGTLKGLMDTSNEAGDDLTPEISGIIAKTFEFGEAEFGIMFNGSYSERDSREEIVSTDGWLRNDLDANATFAANVDTTAVNEDINPGVIYSPRNLVTDISDHKRKRENAQLVLQFSPWESLTATLDYTISNYEDEINRAQTAVWFDQNLVTGTANANGTLINPTITTDGATFGALDYNSYYDEVVTENKSLGFNVDWQATDNLSFNFDYHDSESHAQPDGQVSDFLTILTAPIGTSYTVDYTQGTDVPILSLTNLAGIDPYDPDGIRPNITLGRGNEMLNEIEELNIRGKWENFSESALKSIHFGVGQVKYSVDTSFSFDLVVYDGSFTSADTANFVTFVPRGDVGSEFSGSDSLPTGFIVYDAAAMQAFYDGAGAGRVFEQNTPVVNEIEEETTSYFAQFNFEDAIYDMPLNVSAGLRYEHTDVSGGTLGFPPANLTWISSTELRAENGPTAEVFSLEGDYDVFLPAVDASIGITENMIIRGSYGRSLSRPDLNRLRPNLAITDTRPGGPYQASIGNPALLPYISDNIDFSYEWYYSDGSYFSLALFKKFVDNYITTSVAEAPIYSDILGCNLTDPSTPGVNPPAATAGTCADPEAIFQISSVENGEAAQVEGLEIAIQHLFGDTGFGVQANYTVVEGDVEFDTTSLDQSVALLGLSDSANLVAFYENYGFQARIAYNWRDEFLYAVDQLRQPGEPVFVEAYGQWDFSASYLINDHFSVFLEGINITDEISRAHGRYEEQFLYAYHGGPRYSFGVRGHF